MTKNRKWTAFGAVALAAAVLAPGAAAAQSCKSAAKTASQLYEKVGEEAVAAGCVAVKLALEKGGTFDVKDLSQCYGIASFATTLTSGLVSYWNQLVGDGSATIGPRDLPFDETEKGKLVGTSGRMYISLPLPTDSAEVTITERDGKAKTSVVVCEHTPDGKFHEVKTVWFNQDDRAKDDRSETRTVSLEGLRGRPISVHLDAKSVANTFEYAVRLAP
jgi:hypothetical protein